MTEEKIPPSFKKKTKRKKIFTKRQIQQNVYTPVEFGW